MTVGSLTHRVRHTLESLEPDEASAVRERLLQHLSGGNPRYLQLLSTVDDAELDALAEASTSATLPPQVQSALAADMDSLTAAQRKVLHALAVAHRLCPLELLEHICGGSGIDVAAVLDQVSYIGLVDTTGSCFSFRHPVMSVVAYQDAGPAWRIRAHRAAAHFLRTRGAPLEVRARHLSAAAPYGDRTAIRTLTEAATAVLDTTPVTAKGWLLTALRLLPGEPELVELRGEILLRLARAHSLSGDLDACCRILHELLGMQTQQRPVAIRYCVVALRLLGRFEEAKALLENELGQASALGEEDDMRLKVELAALHILHSDTSACARIAGNVVTVARKMNDRGHMAAGQMLIALSDLQQGHIPAARTRLADLAPLVDGQPDVDVREHLHLFPPLVWLELNLNRHGDAVRHLRRGMTIARRSGQHHALPYLHIMQAELLTRSGHLESALQRVEQAMAMSRLTGSSETLAMSRAVALTGVLWRHGPPPAVELAQQLTTEGAPKSRWWADVAAASTMTVRACTKWPADEIEISDNSTPLLRPQLYGAAAVALAGESRLAEAISLAREAVSLAHYLTLDYQLGAAQHALATVLVTAQQHEAAALAASAAVHAFSTAKAPLHVAMAAEAHAHALIGAGDHGTARLELGRAKAQYADAGARWLVTQANRHNIRLGARAPRTRSTRDSEPYCRLSDREQEVAQLAADGLSNRAIAQRLYLSQRTVETHLSKVYNKLGVRSRVDMARHLPHAHPAQES
jgi:DNA-binding NarL/FixJ family response regulator